MEGATPLAGRVTKYGRPAEPRGAVLEARNFTLPGGPAGSTTRSSCRARSCGGRWWRVGGEPNAGYVLFWTNNLVYLFT